MTNDEGKKFSVFLEFPPGHHAIPSHELLFSYTGDPELVYFPRHEKSVSTWFSSTSPRWVINHGGIRQGKGGFHRRLFRLYTLGLHPKKKQKARHKTTEPLGHYT